MNERTRLWLFTFLALVSAACHRKPGLDAASLRRGVETYLAQRGDLCIARQVWPVDVAESDRAVRTRDAVQMPVLERLGVVEGHRITVRATGEDGKPANVAVTRYELTERGRQSYIDRRTRKPVDPSANARAGQGGEVPGDLCVARVSLDKVVGWDASPSKGEPKSAVVSYTYKIDPVAWMRDPEALRVFPAIARMIAGAGKAELTEGLILTSAGWLPNELAPATPAAAGETVASQQGARP